MSIRKGIRKIVFCNSTAHAKISTLPLHAPLQILRAPTPPPRQRNGPDLWRARRVRDPSTSAPAVPVEPTRGVHMEDRKSTRLNSSHANIPYAVFRLNKTTFSSRLQAPPQQPSLIH